MKIFLRLNSNPLLIKSEISIDFDPFLKVEDLKKQISRETPNKFKRLSFQNKDLEDDNALGSYNLSSESELEIRILDEILIIFQSFENPYEMNVSILEKKYTFQTLLQEFQNLYNFDEWEISYITPPLNENESIWNCYLKSPWIIPIKIKRNYSTRIQPIIEEEEEKLSFINTQLNTFIELSSLDTNSDKNDLKETVLKENFQEQRKNHIQKVKEICVEDIEKNIGPLVNESKKLLYKELIGRVEEDQVTIVVTGQSSSGKSSFLNLLISYFLDQVDFLPIYEFANTGFIWTITKSKDERISIQFQDKTEYFDITDNDGIKSLIKEIDEKQSELFAVNKPPPQNLDSVEIKHPFFPDKLRLVDCPGFSTETIYQKINDFLKTQIVHCFFIKNIKDADRVGPFFEELIKETKKDYGQPNFYIIFSNKDNYFGEYLKKNNDISSKKDEYLKMNSVVPANNDNLKKKILRLIMIVNDHLYLMKKYKLNPQGVYCLDLTKNAIDYSLNRLLKVFDQLLSDSDLYNLKNCLSHIKKRLFKKEKEEDINIFLNDHQMKVQAIKTKREEILGQFSMQLKTFFDNLCKEDNEQRKEWKKKIKELSGNLKKHKKKTEFMNEIIRSLEEELNNHLVTKIQEISKNLIDEFFYHIEQIFGKKYMSDKLCIGEKHLSKISQKKYAWDKKTFMCLVLDKPYTKLYTFETITGFFNNVVSWGYSFQNHGLFWRYKGAEYELNSHLTNIFLLQKDICLRDTVDCFGSILENICNKFESLQIFEDKYELAKIPINEVQIKIENEFPDQVNSGKNVGLNLLDWKDLYPEELANYEKVFHELKLTEMMKFK